MAKLRGLGRGLDVLLSASNIEKQITTDKSALREIPLSELIPGKYQPRLHFDQDKLNELADSIKEKGVIQPILVRKLTKGYEIIAGERRFRASKLAKLTHIPAIVKELNDEETLAVALIENIQRKDLNVVEEALGYKRLIDEFNLTHEALAKVTGRSRSHISNILRMLNLSVEVQQMVINGQLDMGHARALLPLDVKQQLIMAQKVLRDNLTTAEVERQVANFINHPKPTKSANKNTVSDANISKLEQELADRFGMSVIIKHKRNGGGSIVLKYESIDELDNLLGL